MCFRAFKDIYNVESIKVVAILDFIKLHNQTCFMRVAHCLTDNKTNQSNINCATDRALFNTTFRA